MEIIVYPHSILKTKCLELDFIGPKVKEYIEEMKAILKKHRGAGLAAPQVGLNIRLFIVKPIRDLLWHEVFINPVLSSVSSQMSYAEEGCLSMPNVRRTILRPDKVTIVARDEKMNRFEILAEKFAARIICHETDHLNGITILDRE